MTPAEFDAFTWGRINPKISVRGAHAVHGWAARAAASEVGEVNGEIVKRDDHGREVSETTIMYEWGDVLYYVSVGVQALGYSLETAMEMNVAKLTDRGNYANYLRQKMEEPTQPEKTPAEIRAFIDKLRADVRRFEDTLPPEYQDSGEIDPAESTP